MLFSTHYHTLYKNYSPSQEENVKVDPTEQQTALQVSKKQVGVCRMGYLFNKENDELTFLYQV